MITKEMIKQVTEKNKLYLFTTSSRSKRIPAYIIEYDAVFTGLSLYHGADALLIKTKSNKVYQLCYSGIILIQDPKGNIIYPSNNNNN